MTILWNEVTTWWNEVTKGWNEVVWNEVVMERSDRIPYFAVRATFDAWLCPASPASTPQTHTRQQKRLSLLNDLCPSPPPAHTNFSPIPITTNAQYFLSHNCPKIKENPKVLKVHINRIQLYPKKSMQTKAITWMCWLQEPFAFHYLQVSSVSLSLKTRTRKIYRHCFLILWRSAEPFNEILPQKASSTGGLWGGGG